MANAIRLAQFAHRLYKQRCRCAVIGDSLNSDEAQPRFVGGYVRNFRPNSWSGYCGLGDTLGNQVAYVNTIPNTTNPATGFGTHGFGTALGGTGGDTSQTGENNIWPTIFGDSGKFTGNPAGFSLYWDCVILANTSGSNMGRTAFWGGDWLTTANSRCRAVVYQGAAGIPSLGRAGYRPNAAGTQEDFADNIALSAGYNNIDIALAADTRDALIQLNATNSGSPNETGKNAYLLGLRWYNTAGTGLEMSFAAKGSSGVAHHIDTARVSDAAITAYVAAYEVDTVIIHLGQNDTIDATWNTNMIALIARWRNAIVAASRVPRILLVCSYQATGTDATKVATMWGYLSAIAQTTGDVSALNLGGIDAGFAAAQGASYLSDGVHPTATGADWLVGIEHRSFLRTMQFVAAMRRAA